MKLIIGLLACGLYASPLVNSVNCKGVNVCTTTWSVTVGNLVVVGGWNQGGGGGNIVDDQANVYAPLRRVGSYNSLSWLYATTARTSGVISIQSDKVESNFVVMEFVGYSSTVVNSANVPYAHGGLCPDPNSFVGGDAGTLTVGVWVMDAGGVSNCTSGMTDVAMYCGLPSPPIGPKETTGGIGYREGVGGIQWSAIPGYNGGDTNCGTYSFSPTAVVVNPPPPPGLGYPSTTYVSPIIPSTNQDNSITIPGATHGLIGMACAGITVVHVFAVNSLADGTDELIHVEPDKWKVRKPSCDVVINFTEEIDNFIVGIVGLGR